MPPFRVSLTVGLVSFCDVVLLLSVFPSMSVDGVVALQLLLLFRLPLCDYDGLCRFFWWFYTTIVMQFCCGSNLEPWVFVYRFDMGL